MKLFRFLKKIFLDIFTPITKAFLMVLRVICFFSMPFVAAEFSRYSFSEPCGNIFIFICTIWLLVQIVISVSVYVISLDPYSDILPEDDCSIEDVEFSFACMFFLSVFHFRPALILKKFSNYFKQTWKDA